MVHCVNIIPIIMACTPQHYSAEFVTANQGNPNFVGKNPNWEAAEYLPATRSAQEDFCKQNGIVFINMQKTFLHSIILDLKKQMTKYIINVTSITF